MKIKLIFFSQLTILSVAFFIYSSTAQTGGNLSLMEKTFLDGRLKIGTAKYHIEDNSIVGTSKPGRRILFYAPKKCMVILF